MLTPKHITVPKVTINGLALYKPESLAVTKVYFIVEKYSKVNLVIYYLDVALR